MEDEVSAYIAYIARLKEIQKPEMPKFLVDAYTENEYRIAIEDVMTAFEDVDDFYLTERFLKGE